MRAVVGRDAEIERTAEGVSTQVYRVSDDGDVRYVRVAEAAGEDLAVEAALLEHLRRAGVTVPDVLDVAPFEDRSLIVLSAIPGEPLGRCTEPQVAAGVARAAGRELALVNRVPVDGWGFVDRSPPPWPLRGSSSGDGPAVLAHGDFDVTPIFHADGVYTGLIDFGEIRGGEPTFDLGHFLLHDRETAPFPLFDAVLAGYEEVAGAVDLEAVRASGLALGRDQLDRWYGRGLPHDHPLAVRRRRQLDRLLVWSAG